MKIVRTPRRKIIKEKAFSIVLLLTLTLLFKFGNTLISFRLLSEDSAWVAFNLTQFIEAAIIPMVGMMLSKPKDVIARTLLLSLFIFNMFSLFEYCILLFSPTLFFVTSTIFLCFIIPVLYRYISDSIQLKSSEYCSSKSFLVYKRPRNLSGSICALVTAPYGHCSLVTSGREFVYKKGILVEKDFLHSNNLTFRKIPQVELGSVRAMLGMKWSISNNCFRTFKKFRKP